MNFEIVNGSIDAPWLGVLYGAGGSGKSWLCSHADDPFFIPVEPGSNLVPAKKFKDIASSYDDLIERMRFVVKERPGKTIVVDGLGFVQDYIYKDVIDKYPYTEGKNPKKVTAIGDYGFGRGYARTMEYWNRFLAGCDAMQKKDMNVILITHSHDRNISTETGDIYKITDMHLQTFGDYSVPELLKRRADWIYYMESKRQVKTIKGQYGDNKSIPAPGTEPETLVWTRATSRFYAKVRTLDETKIPDCYTIERSTRSEDSRKIFEDMI